MSWLLGGIIAHVLLAGAIASPWVVPNVTLVGLIISIARTPARWFALSVTAGVVLMAWAVRFPVQIFVCCLALGGTMRTLGRHWDATDLRVQTVMVGFASLALTAGALWLDDLGSLPLLGLAVAHIAVTILAVPCARYLGEHGSAVRRV